MEEMLWPQGTDDVLFYLHPIMFLLQTDAVAMTTLTVSMEEQLFLSLLFVYISIVTI